MGDQLKILRHACSGRILCPKSRLVFLLFFTSTISSAQPEVPNDDRSSFSDRFSLALTRYGNYGDVLGAGNASTGSTFASSSNPAAAAWRGAYGYQLSLSPQQSKINFDNGSSLKVNIIGGTRRLHSLSEPCIKGIAPADCNRIQTMLEFGVASVRSNRASPIVNAIPVPGFLSVSADLFTVGISRRAYHEHYQVPKGSIVRSLGMSLRRPRQYAYGAEVTYRRTRFSMDPVLKSKSPSFGVRIGGQIELLPDSVRTTKGARKDSWLVAGASVGFSDTNTNSVFLSTHSTSSSDTIDARVGLSYRVVSGTYLNLDYQKVKKYSCCDPEGVKTRLSTSRIYAGVSWTLGNAGDIPRGLPVTVRAGYARDDFGNSSYTAGVGLIFANGRSGIDLAFQRNMFPELQPELGNSKLVNLSLRWKW